MKIDKILSKTSDFNTKFSPIARLWSLEERKILVHGFPQGRIG